MGKLPYAEELKNFWKTSRTQPDTWIDKAQKQIERMGGKVTTRGYIDDDGKKAYLLGFKVNEDLFKVIWPVCPSRTGDESAARIQAATMLYHDIKAKSLKVRIFGARTSFFEYYALPDGRTAGQVSDPEFLANMPKMLTHND